MPRKALLFMAAYFGLSLVAWYSDGMEYVRECLTVFFGWAGAAALVVTIIVYLYAFLRNPDRKAPKRTAYAMPAAPRPAQAISQPLTNVQASYQPPPAGPAYQAPPSNYVPPSYRPAPSAGRPYQPSSGWVSETLYHGTPTLQNAFDIADSGSGFIVGSGNRYGNGVYFGDFVTAQEFAEGAGAIVRVLLHVPAHQIADLNRVKTSRNFQAWCLSNGNGNQGENITDYVLTILRRRFLKVTGKSIYVALANPTFGNERVVFEGIKVLGVLNPQGNLIKGG